MALAGDVWFHRELFHVIHTSTNDRLSTTIYLVV